MEIVCILEDIVTVFKTKTTRGRVEGIVTYGVSRRFSVLMNMKDYKFGNRETRYESKQEFGYVNLSYGKALVGLVLLMLLSVARLGVARHELNWVLAGSKRGLARLRFSHRNSPFLVNLAHN
jgi:hypothetical protein